jgi:hypothetical protein
METYRHSGAISPIGIFLASAAGIATAIVLGVIYSFGIVHIPIVQINFLLTLGFGCVMGVAVGWGAKTGKIRNPFVATAYGFVVGLIGLYVAWGTDYLARVLIPGGDHDLLKAFSPTELMDYIQWFYQNGMWAMKGDKNISGIPLAIVWALEAAIILGGSTYLARQFILHVPFCEDCGRWTVNKAGTRFLSLIGAGDPLKQLLSGDLTALENFNLAQSESVYLQLDLATCPGCTESNYLTVQQAKQTLDKEGKLKTELTPLVRNMLVAAEDLPLIQTAGREPQPPENVDKDDEPSQTEPPKMA